jgi:hypothetical protein
MRLGDTPKPASRDAALARVACPGPAQECHRVTRFTTYTVQKHPMLRGSARNLSDPSLSHYMRSPDLGQGYPTLWPYRRRGELALASLPGDGRDR